MSGIGQDEDSILLYLFGKTGLKCDSNFAIIYADMQRNNDNGGRKIWDEQREKM